MRRQSKLIGTRMTTERVASRVLYANTSGSNARRNRGGFTIVELIGTCLLLGILFSMTVPMLLVVARERRSAEQRQFALQQAANLLEGAVKRNWSDLEPGELIVPDPDTDLQAVLPGLQPTLTVKQLDGEFDTRQIIASIRWQNRACELVNPLQLSAWVHSMREVP
jgi:type II secretory pathway pseudopilin PulG